MKSEQDTTLAQQLAKVPVNWSDILSMVKEFGGTRDSHRGDDRWRFPDGSVAVVRGLTFVGCALSHRSESTLPIVQIIDEELPTFCGDVRDSIGRLTFVFAKTMPDVPHEYVLRLKTPNDCDYVALYDFVMRDGLITLWRGRGGKIANPRPSRSLCVDGWWYWSMSPKRTVQPYAVGRHPLYLSHHINRCTNEAWQRLVDRGWIVTRELNG